MEYINGTNIDEFIERHPEMIDDIFEQTINGFSYLESKEILHRDIRPTNILVDNGGFVKIIDFGFGKKINTISDFDRSFSSLNWWCALPQDFQVQIYDFKTEVYFIGKLFEKLITNNDITSFSYSHILSKMCEPDPKLRINSFEAVKREITGNKFFDELFNEEEVNIYQEFANELSKLIINLDKDCKYSSNIEIIQKYLSDLYKNTMLERYIPGNDKIIECFIDGMYRYWTNIRFKTKYLKNFLKFLKSCSNEKKNIVLSNLHSRFDSIERKENDLISEDEIPF